MRLKLPIGVKNSGVTRSAAAVVMVGLLAAFVGLLPSAPGRADQGNTYRQALPMVASDSASAAVPSDSQPAALARELSAATTDDARTAALDRIFDALAIGVYRPDGTPVVSGAETSADDFYFYTQETAMMSGALGRGQRWSVDDLAAFLNTPGLLANGQTVAAAQLQTAISDVIQQASQSPTAANLFEAELVHQLGLQHTPPDDLAVASDPSAPVLDAVQRAIILSDLLINLPRVSNHVAASSALVASSQGILTQSQVTAQDVCGDFSPCKKLRPAGNFAAGFLPLLGDAVKVLTMPVDFFHGISLALGVQVQALADNLKTHYGHETPGAELQFPVMVRMLDELTQTQFNCGWMAGVTFPKQGPIPGIKIDWDPTTLASHGEIVCESACQQTGDDGIATLIFKPKSETAPFTGPLASEHGKVVANALYLSSLGNVFGPADELATPKDADFLWEVDWHSKGSWAGTVTMTWDQPETSAEGTANVRFDVAVPATGEGDTHTNIYRLAQGTDQWSQTLPDCKPAPQTGSATLPPGSASLTVTETDGMMTYEFVMTDGQKVPYTTTCGEDPPTSVPVFAVPPAFPFPMSGPEMPSYKSGPIPISDTISGSTYLQIDDATVVWNWDLHRT